MTFAMQRSGHTDLTPREAADRLAIRELVDAYAHCADRRDVVGQMSLFTADTEFLVYMDSRNPVPTQEIRGRDSLRPVFENLSAYEATTHFNGQSTVTWEQDAATGVSYCLAHHVKVEGQTRSLMIASIRYLDQFVKMDGYWYFRQRKLMVDWIDNRPLGGG
jgi:SnoaL-like domain